MALPQMRYWSNKENSSPISLAATSFTRTHISKPKTTTKPRVSGIGRVPKPSRQHPSTKPYDRITSIQRAKLRATKSNRNKHKQRPTPLHLATSTGIRGRYRQPDRTVHIPLQLPRPMVPPVDEVDGALTDIPVSYTFDRLKPYLPTLFAVSQLYRPQPHLNSPLSHISHRPTMAFVIPELLKGDVDGIHDGLRAKIKGMEPDVCVAVTGKGLRAGDVPRIYAVKEVVLQVYCAYWPQIAAPTAADKGKSTVHEARRSLSPVTECTESGSDTESDASSDTVTPLDSSPNASFASTSTFAGVPENILHLPIIPLSLPSPETFPLLLVHLHTPSRPFAPKLLGLPSTITERRDILVELDKLTVPELMMKLGQIHSIWKNVCTLGVGDERTWSEMALAWSCVLSVLAGRGGGWAWAEQMRSKGTET